MCLCICICASIDHFPIYEYATNNNVIHFVFVLQSIIFRFMNTRLIIMLFIFVLPTLKGEVEKQVSELRRQLAAVQPDIESALRRMNEAINNEKLARQDLAIQVSIPYICYFYPSANGVL